MQMALKTPLPLPETVDMALAPGEGSLLRFITCGSVDDGKSTLIGRVLYEAGAVFDDQLEALDRDSKKFGTTGEMPDFALLVDGLSAEREQGITIDVAYRYFQTPKRAFIVADTPGHEQYTRNMATGASTADVAIILIDARKGVLPQTRRHSFIVSLEGVKRIIVAVNKMDLIGFDEARFRAIEADYKAAVASLGFTHMTIIPVSALMGENITSASSAMRWYHGKPLLPLLEEIETAPPIADATVAFAMPVQWVNRPNLDFRGFAGSIATGSIAKGDAVTVLPSGRSNQIKRIVTHDGDLERAYAGQAVTLTLMDEVDVSRGDVLASGPDLRYLRVQQEISAHLLVTADLTVRPGDQFIVKIGTAQANATVIALHHAIDIESYAQVPLETFAMNTIGRISLRFDKPLVSTLYAESIDLGGFILLDRASNQTAAFGFVIEDEPRANEYAPGDLAHGKRPSAQDTALIRWFGAPKSERRHKRIVSLTWALISATLIMLLVIGLGGGLVAGLMAGLADLILRPLLRGGHAALWAYYRDRKAARELTDIGAGI